MTLKGILTVPLVLLLSFGQTGCSSQQLQQPAHDHAQDSGAAHEHHENADQSNAAPSHIQTGKAIQDELNGLSTIEAAVNKGDFDSASKTFEPLHHELHSTVLPAIQVKNAKLSDDIHSNFDALEDALGRKDKNKTLGVIKTIKDSLNQAAKELGISIK